MDFKQLESFITIAKYNSFSKAARELYLTQPTLSNHIQNLESELGILLFDRKGKTIELTDAGKTFKNHAVEIIKKRDSAVFTINDIIGKTAKVYPTITNDLVYVSLQKEAET